MNIKGILKGSFLSFLIAAVFLIGGAALTYFNRTDERTASLIVFAGAVIGVFIGALGACKSAESKILLNALSVSLLFAALIVCGSLGINGGFAFHSRTIALLGSVMGAGVLGAMFGK